MPFEDEQWSEIIPRLSKLTPVPLSFERREHRGVVFINDCYSADPTSMKTALKNLPIPGPGKKRIGGLWNHERDE
ncbi:MAG: hypothetical protein JSR93_11445 [Verrucomicrobia bacterium]|nr:hypothetical protein [Verrucomicrobiota bacterium]